MDNTFIKRLDSLLNQIKDLRFVAFPYLHPISHGHDDVLRLVFSAMFGTLLGRSCESKTTPRRQEILQSVTIIYTKSMHRVDCEEEKIFQHGHGWMYMYNGDKWGNRKPQNVNLKREGTTLICIWSWVDRKTSFLLTLLPPPWSISGIALICDVLQQYVLKEQCQL